MAIVDMEDANKQASMGESYRLLENEHVVVDKVHERGQVFPLLHSTSVAIDEIYWLTGDKGGELQAQRHDPGTKAPGRGIRLTLLKQAAKTSETEQMSVVGTRLLYTDDKVTIWEFFLPPGTRCPYHQHRLPYFYTNLTESLTQDLDKQGNVKNHSPRRLQQLNLTKFLPRKELGEHAVMNVGESDLLQFIVELKEVP